MALSNETQKLRDALLILVVMILTTRQRVLIDFSLSLSDWLPSWAMKECLLVLLWLKIMAISTRNRNGGQWPGESAKNPQKINGYPLAKSVLSAIFFGGYAKGRCVCSAQDSSVISLGGVDCHKNLDWRQLLNRWKQFIKKQEFGKWKSLLGVDRIDYQLAPVFADLVVSKSIYISTQ